MIELLRRPSAFLPLMISAGFLPAFLVGLASGHLVRQPDEDTLAHLFALLMPAQFSIVLFFAISWLPRRRIAALEVLAFQLSAASAVLAIVFFREL